jgi:hypothetical protein
MLINVQALAVYRVVESWREDLQSCVLVFESSVLGPRTICDSTQKAGVLEAAFINVVFKHNLQQ